VSFEHAIFQWQEGERRLGSAVPSRRPALERVTDRIAADLRRRLGGSFTTAELVELYDAGTDWCLDLAMATAPDEPAAWDLQTVANAAFSRYVRAAHDFAGGRRVETRSIR
jgi:hypothetical protein